ncbi:MAG: hypothetical protein ACOYMA_19070 [Bacteroidia bacterium]
MKKLTTTEKINQIRQNDKVNGMIEQAIELLEALKYYIDEFDDEDSDKKVDDFIAVLEAKDTRNTNESKRLCVEIVNEQNRPNKKTINEKNVY